MGVGRLADAAVRTDQELTRRTGVHLVVASVALVSLRVLLVPGQ